MELWIKQFEDAVNGSFRESAQKKQRITKSAMKEKNKRNFSIVGKNGTTDRRQQHKSARLRRIDCSTVYLRELLTNIYISESVRSSKCTAMAKLSSVQVS